MVSPEDGPDGPLAGHPGPLRPLTRDLVAEVLAAQGHAVTPDDRGDLVGRWQDALIWFLLCGAAGEMLQVRTLAAPAFAIDHVPALHAFCNSWNRDRFWPKAFVHVDDAGRARVCGEVITDLERGATTHQLARLLDRGVATGRRLAAATGHLPGSVTG
ncbi:Putative sensory transduction regulator [Micromonospora nigra]|uniref:Putative sensory transduction regulator n=1 Tax=Micromonospora nigra TaxID=145857 RepID=A0A1C6SMK5_9ACTN|nr:YbjN domain-containing protein [Micromonospora nigra]SCL30667.1 Putative sensory transduction regulator [Micromonospora nigra]